MKIDSQFLFSSKFINHNKPHNRKLRVFDILISDNMGDNQRRESCMSYGSILSWWLRRRRKEKMERGNDESSLRTRYSMNCSNEESKEKLMVEERNGGCEVGNSGRCRKEASFHLGVGFGLIYLMAIIRNELKEMIELRKQMETLLQNGRQELHLPTKTLETSNNMAYSTTDIEESVNNSDSCLTKKDSGSHISSHIESKMKRKQGLDADMHRFDECFDQLEADFETEMESLQLHLDSDHSALDLHPEVVVEEAAPEEGDCGVSPYELNTRLHELLQEKQEERIQELEVALGRAKQKLREKEKEKCWWKDTAQLLAKGAVKS